MKYTHNFKPEDITVVIIRAPGYSGATWLNLVLGSHKEAISLGPPVRLFELEKKDADLACFIHRGHCDFWPPFLRGGDHVGSFIRDIANYSGKRWIFLNYPPKEYLDREVKGKGFRILHIKLVREGKANLHSYLRHTYPVGKRSVIRGIIEWQIPIIKKIEQKMPTDKTLWVQVRLEDIINNPLSELKRLGDFLGLKYSENAIKFWEYNHHITAGNTGLIHTLCQLRGYEGHYHPRIEEYDRIIAEIRKNPNYTYLDNSWESSFTYMDRLAFDCLMGENNAKYGYQRENFPEKDIIYFRNNLYNFIDDAMNIDYCKPISYNQRIKEEKLKKESSTDKNIFYSIIYKTFHKVFPSLRK